MNAEIIAVGSEILLGQIVNTNATYLSQQLAELGINVYHSSVVGDNAARMTAAIKLAHSRSDLVILVGGTGPTDDDLTKPVLAKYLQRKLVIDQPALKHIEQHFAQTDKPLTPNNRRQAEYVAGGQALQNPAGLAVGCWIKAADATEFMIVPGPPRELKAMFAQVIRPQLLQQNAGRKFLHSVTMRFFGIGESLLVTKLADLIAKQTNPTIAPYAKECEVTLRITASAATKDQAKALVATMKQTIIERVGDFYYGDGDDTTLPQVVVERLKQTKQTVTAAESLTAGLFQAQLASVPGASQVFSGGFVTYANEEKTHLVNVPAAVIKEHTVVSGPVVEAMALGAQKQMKTDFAVALSGVAGPDALEGHPVGEVWIAVAKPDHTTSVRQYHFAGSRSHIRQLASFSAFALLNDVLKEEAK